MTTTAFLMLLSAFSILSGLVTEVIKDIVKDRANLSFNIVALVVSLIIGGVGTGIYYQLNSIAFTMNNVIYIILMGFASALCSMIGFDKVKQALIQCGFIKK